MSARPEPADILRRHGSMYRHLHADSLSGAQHRVMRAIEQCRTAALGGHLEQCDACGHQRIAFNSCRNRHCPKCQSLARAQWLDDRQADLLPVPYFHVVFTVPESIAAIAFQNKRVVYDILFQATADTLQTFAACAAPKCNATGRLFQSTAPDAKPRSVSFKWVTADSQVSAWIRIGGVLIFEAIDALLMAR
ncbi:hypothetical protein WS71_00150 [Burkholderia mayonis]|uniref:Transposase zinc-binding domain-containing protein n=1 Tax=Burkholderia mayonis TaxID=1385591 RepID=A0A1B4FQJ4_9BURK|nr:hypothetical protein WS71_00150 [Burkholderia mayonis]KVE49063.1 hypothetical protein WS71_17035 [Burkholderia mayonis]